MEIGIQELLFIGAILLFFFGPSKLPELGTGIGKAIRDFKQAVSGAPDEEKHTESLVASKTETPETETVRPEPHLTEK